MTTKYTPEQLLHAFIQVDGHVLELYGRWRLFSTLYRGNEDSQPILAEVASEMFWLLGRLLHRGCLLLYRQLTDGPTTAGRRNASLEGLLAAFAGTNYREDAPDLMALLTEARSGSIRDHANRYIAHLDFDLLAGVGTPPEGIAPPVFDAMLGNLREFINGLGIRYLDRSPRDHAAEAMVMVQQAQKLVATISKGRDV